MTAETIEKIRKTSTGRWHSEKTKKKMSETRIRLKLSAGQKNPMCREDVVRKWIASNRISPNKQELKLKSLLKHVSKSILINVKGEWLILGGKIPDFVSIRKKKIIELYGDYWHRGEDTSKRINFFKLYGYGTLIVWEKELKNEKVLILKIKKFMNSK